MGKGQYLQQWCWENWAATSKRMKLDHYIIHKKLTENGLKDLNVIPETVKLLEENVSGKLLDSGLGLEFLDLTLKAKAMKAKINK